MYLRILHNWMVFCSSAADIAAAIGSKGKKTKVTVPVDLLAPHGQIYAPVNSVPHQDHAMYAGDVSLSFSRTINTKISLRSELSVLDYFLECVPKDMLNEILEGTNEEMHRVRNTFHKVDKDVVRIHVYDVTEPITDDNAPRVQRLLDKQGLLQFLGIRLAMCVDPVRGEVRKYWDKKDSDDPDGDVVVPRNYGRYIEYNRFAFISQCFRLRKDSMNIEAVSGLLRHFFVA